MGPPAVENRDTTDMSAESGEKEDVSSKHVLRQAQLSRELQELNVMLADKQELAGQMMRNDQQLESVKLQYEVSTLYLQGLHVLKFLIPKIYQNSSNTCSRIWYRYFVPESYTTYGSILFSADVSYERKTCARKQHDKFSRNLCNFWYQILENVSQLERR